MQVSFADAMIQTGGERMETLRTEHLSKYYGEKENRVIALDDVSFSVDPG